MKNPLFILMISCYSAIFSEKDPRVIQIAQQMRDLAPQCQYLSPEAMIAVRRKFLENNRDATIAQLVDSIDTFVDGKDIISYFRSFDGSVCQEHALLLMQDKERGIRAINRWLGSVSVGTAIDHGRL